jgi:hypothetical protein
LQAGRTRPALQNLLLALRHLPPASHHDELRRGSLLADAAHAAALLGAVETAATLADQAVELLLTGTTPTPATDYLDTLGFAFHVQAVAHSRLVGIPASDRGTQLRDGPIPRSRARHDGLFRTVDPFWRPPETDQEST